MLDAELLCIKCLINQHLIFKYYFIKIQQNYFFDLYPIKILDFLAKILSV